jgi:Mg-chelatase subunit ChlD
MRQPILADIEFRPDGDPILGLRDRQGDMQPFTIGMGDLLPTVRTGDRWDVITDPEVYQDDVAPHVENVWGALAAFPGKDWVVASALAPVTINSGGALWFDNASGAVERKESLYETFNGDPAMLPTFAKSQGLGDLEAFCPAELLPTPTPTFTPSPSPSPTSSPTATWTPSPTATPVPVPIYLPILLSEECSDRTQHADIAIVIDVSTSMDRPSASGLRKMEAAQEAVRSFLATMEGTAGSVGEDQVALVGFNDDWWLEQGLTANRTALEAAINRLPARVAQGTRLDLAVEGGLAALASPARNPANSPVMVLLTDGLPNRVPTPSPAGSQEDTVLAVAARAKAAGVRLFTVGLGARTDIDAALMAAMATAPELFFYAPDAEELADIYSQIAYTIACPGGRHDWSRPWP